jgi:hypothetical protein
VSQLGPSTCGKRPLLTVVKRPRARVLRTGPEAWDAAGHDHVATMRSGEPEFGGGTMLPQTLDHRGNPFGER